MTQDVASEMTANVWKIVMKEGDRVSDGDEIMILESMKMEIPVLAEADGVIVKIHVTENDAIREGDVLATIGDA